MRQRISRELLERHGFSFIAAEADWPDAAAVDAYVRRGPDAAGRPREIFGRFPTGCGAIWNSSSSWSGFAI